MEVVHSWADELAELCNNYNGVESGAFFAVVGSGSRMSNYISIVSFQESTSAKQPLRGRLRWPMFSHWLQMQWRISSGGSLRMDGLLIVPS